MASTKQTIKKNPLLTRRAALTRPPGALFLSGKFDVERPRPCGQYREGW